MAIKLPYLQTEDRQFNQYQQALSTALSPITTGPLSNVTLLTSIALVTGLNIIPTTINRNLQGWFIVRQRAQANIWDTQDVNTTPSQNLYLNTSANVTVDLVIF